MLVKDIHLRHFICGPSSASLDCCPVGARTVGPCAHVAACLLVGSILPGNPAAYRPSHRTQNLLDPGQVFFTLLSFSEIEILAILLIGDGLPPAATLGNKSFKFFSTPILYITNLELMAGSYG